MTVQVGFLEIRSRAHDEFNEIFHIPSLLIDFGQPEPLLQRFFYLVSLQLVNAA